MAHYLNCSRCGYHRPLDTRVLLSRQTTCPQCPMPSRLELLSEPLAAQSARGSAAERMRLPSHTNHSL